ncbi:MAG TPA: PIN domain-containing protein [Thermoanaerobaculia bacterium]|nr:PIN domain-containing protein [Thermoanaerobaculia bacterium]
MIVVDSSVLIDWFKGRATPTTDRLQDLENAGIPFSIPGVCLQEVLQGARDEREWKLLSEYLESQDLLLSADSVSTHRDAARIFYDCRRKGITIRSSVDCFIAQLALEHDGVLLHDDDDFEWIRQVRPLKTMRA